MPVVTGCCVAAPPDIGHLNFFREASVQAVTRDAVDIGIDRMWIAGCVDRQCWRRLSNANLRRRGNKHNQRHNIEGQAKRNSMHESLPETRSSRISARRSNASGVCYQGQWYARSGEGKLWRTRPGNTFVHRNLERERLRHQSDREARLDRMSDEVSGGKAKQFLTRMGATRSGRRASTGVSSHPHTLRLRIKGWLLGLALN